MNKNIIINPRRSGKSTMGLLQFLKTFGSTAMADNNITTSVLTEELLNNCIKEQFIYKPPRIGEGLMPHHFEYNAFSAKRLNQLFGPVNENEVMRDIQPHPHIFSCYGFTIIENKKVPKNELWLCNKYGGVLKIVRFI